MTVTIDSMGIGLIMPVMPDLITEVNGGTLANAAIWGGILSASYAVMQFVFGPILGSLSDRFGRRRVLLVSLAVMTVDYVVMALAGSIWLLLLGRLIGGITAATQATAAAYIADITPANDRGARFGLLSAAFGMGFILGPLIGGLLGDLGTRAPFWAAAALAGANLIFGMIILPETLKPENRRAFSLARANPLGALRSVRKLPGLAPLLVVLFLYQVSFHVYPVIWSYFTQAQFSWDPGMIGLSLAAFGVSIAIVQAGVIRLSLRHLGEVGTVIAGLCFAALSFVLLTVVTSGALALALTPIAALAAIATPALQSIMSAKCADDAQGELQGVIASVNALALITSPLLMTSVFAKFTSPGTAYYLPGAPFLASAALCVLGLALFLRARRRKG
ncbi:MFS transporter [Roseovarius carneus]|uniref:MFS transporter n=1 Tax=Roseovarius carneus TaxID=2853164 RepID=UPI0037C7EF9B